MLTSTLKLRQARFDLTARTPYQVAATVYTTFVVIYRTLIFSRNSEHPGSVTCKDQKIKSRHFLQTSLRHVQMTASGRYRKWVYSSFVYSLYFTLRMTTKNT
jgi:hypothetical protein